MTADDILIWLRAKGISLWVQNGELRFKAPDGRLTPKIKERLKARREEIIKALEDSPFVRYRAKVKRWPEDMRADFWAYAEEQRAKGADLDQALEEMFQCGERQVKAMKLKGLI